jgi:hypothetical protein
MANVIKEFHQDHLFNWKTDQDQGVVNLRKYYECNKNYFDTVSSTFTNKNVILFYYNGEVRFITVTGTIDDVDLAFFRYFRAKFGSISAFFYCPQFEEEPLLTMPSVGSLLTEIGRTF